MKLYLAVVSWDYEGSEAIGVYSTPEKAQAACDNHKYKDGELRGDYRRCMEVDLDADLWTPI